MLFQDVGEVWEEEEMRKVGGTLLKEVGFSAMRAIRLRRNPCYCE